MNRKILHGNSWSFQEIIQQKFLESGKKMLLEHLQFSVFSKGKSYRYSSNSVIMKRIFTLNVLLSFHFLRNKLTTNIYFNRTLFLSMVSGNALKSLYFLFKTLKFLPESSQTFFVWLVLCKPFTVYNSIALWVLFFSGFLHCLARDLCPIWSLSEAGITLCVFTSFLLLSSH